MNNDEKIIFCKKCLYNTAHPLGLTINERGICSGCEVHEEKYKLNWQERFKKLKKIVQMYKSKNKNNYDCIVPVSGGSESYWILHIVKNKLKLNPILVSYNKYFNTDLGIRNLSNLRIKFDCDILIQNVNPLSVKKITRTTFRNLGSIYWPCIAGQTAFPVQTAVDFKIPLIIWGSHQGTEQTGMFSHEHEVEMTRRYRKDHDLMGYEADDLLKFFDTLNEEDIWQYRYPDDLDLKKIGVRGIYLSNYIPWDPKKQDELMIKKYNFKTSKNHRSFDTYDHIDCYNYFDTHDLLKLYKHGYSKVTDHACREIRHKRLNKVDAHNLVLNYEQKPLKFKKYFCEWLNIEKNSYNFLMNLNKNKNYWKLLDWDKQTWSFNGWSKLRKISLIKLKNCEKNLNFVYNDKLNEKNKIKYYIIGKGHP
jgi:N-acetyl sugar amidotransferase